ncbi:hypothetical protein D9M73_224150 [compost metagenome]
MLDVVLRMAEVEVGHFSAQVTQDILVLGAVFFQGALQCSLADVERCGDRLHVIGALAKTQALIDQRANSPGDGNPAYLVQLCLGKAVMQGGQRLVGCRQRMQQFLPVEQDAVVCRPKNQRTIKKPLMFAGVCRFRIGEGHTQGTRHVPTGKPTA